MNKSESIKELAMSLSKAQGEFPVIPKTKVAKVRMKAGGEYTYNYADLSDIIKATSPVLSKHGLAVSQDYVLIGDNLLFIETALLHSSGEWKTSLCPLRLMTTPQEQGSENTYYRRYALCAALGIHAEEDDDGAIAGDKGHDYSSSVKKPPQESQIQGYANQSTVAAVIKPKPIAAQESSPIDFDFGVNALPTIIPDSPRTKESKERAKVMADMADAMVKGKWSAEQLRIFSKKKYGAEGAAELTNAEIQDLIKTVLIYKFEELA